MARSKEQLDGKTLERIAKLRAMTLDEIREVQKRCEANNDYDFGFQLRAIWRKDEFAMQQLMSTSYVSGSRINEINFNIGYDKYIPIKKK